MYDAETITVYQAFGAQIAGPAAARGRFPGAFRRERMTWIKPSFLWMMYRCGWASKPGQERVLAVRITRAGFEWALLHAAIAHFDAGIHTDQDEWRASLRAPVRVQWDPERDLYLRPGNSGRCRWGFPGRRCAATATSGSPASRTSRISRTGRAGRSAAATT